MASKLRVSVVPRFPVEVLHCIFCLCSQSDLVSLSQANSILQRIAEDILYRNVYTSPLAFIIPDKKKLSWKPRERTFFHTLSSNPQKAALLRHLHIQFGYDRPYYATQANYSIMKWIVKVLLNAPKLVDFRIMVDQRSDTSRGELSKAIKSGCFQLRTLYCDACQDLAGIIISQKHLQLLGIFDGPRNHPYDKVSDLVQDLYNNRLGIDNSRRLPGIFILGSYDTTYDLSQLILFPELCLPGQTLTLCQDIATSLSQDLGKRYSANKPHFLITIKAFDFSFVNNDPIICEMVDAASKCFAGCRNFTLGVHGSTAEGVNANLKPWRIPGLATSISQFKQLRRLGFHVCDNLNISLYEVAEDLHSILYEFVLACPLLELVLVQDFEDTAFMAPDSDWEIQFVIG